jgi:hypothetical protein
VRQAVLGSHGAQVSEQEGMAHGEPPQHGAGMEGGAGGGGGAAQDGGAEEAGRRREGEGRVPGHAGGRWSQAVSVAFILLFLARLNWI